MKKYVVEEKPLQAILDYLATKPYKETVTLITNIQASVKLSDETKIYSQVDLEAAKNAAKAETEEIKKLNSLEKFSDD